MSNPAPPQHEADPADPGLVAALRDLAHAVRALQLYPPSSPVVSQAVARAHGNLSPLLNSGRLSLAVLPDTIRVGTQDAGGGGHTIRSLARRLHERGIAHLHLEPSLQSATMQRLAEMLATDADALNETGGVSALLESQQLEGIAIEMLQLEKLYEEHEEAEHDPDATLWEHVLGAYCEDLDVSEMDWAALAGDSERLADFLAWILDDEAPPPGISEMSRLQVVRTVCERVGEAAATLGPDRVEAVAEVIGGLYDKLDREVWINLLGQPLDIAVDVPATAGGDPLAGIDVDPGERSLRTTATELGSTDLAQGVGASLTRDQVEDLLVYSLTSRDTASPRIFGLFHRLLEERGERDLMEQAIRAAVERQSETDAERQSFAELWPRLTEAIQGENMDPYVSSTYRAQLDQLLNETPATGLWDLERIMPRARELEPGYLVQRKAKVVLEVLAAETDDDDYIGFVGELERALPELVADGQYIATEEVLKAFASDLVPANGRSDGQRAAAREVLIRFCNERTLREVVRNLAGKPSTQIDAATRIFSSLGPMAVPALLEALSGEQSRPIRVHLVRMLAAMGDQALPEIRKHLRDKRWFFVRNLVFIIGEIGDFRFVPHLSIIINHPDVRVRREAVRSMAKLRNDAAPQVLLSALDDEDTEVRMLALRGLGTARAQDAVPRLRELIRLPNRAGGNTEIMRAAAIALGRIGDADALADLKQLARRPWFFRRRRIAASEAAAWAVATLQGERTGEAPELRPRTKPPTATDDDAAPSKGPR